MCEPSWEYSQEIFTKNWEINSNPASTSRYFTHNLDTIQTKTRMRIECESLRFTTQTKNLIQRIFRSNSLKLYCREVINMEEKNKRISKSNSKFYFCIICKSSTKKVVYVKWCGVYLYEIKIDKHFFPQNKV